MFAIESGHACTHSQGPWDPGELSAGSDADVGRALARAFDAAVAHPTRFAMATLRTETLAIAAALRRTESTPERAVVALKTLLRGHGGPGWAPSIAAERGVAPASPASRVYGALFSWWVAEYYAECSREAVHPPAVLAAPTA